MKKFGIIILLFSLFTFFNINFINADTTTNTWDKEFWYKTQKEVQKEINKTKPLDKMTLFSGHTLYIKGFNGVKVKKYKVTNELFIYFFDDKMVREQYTKKFSNNLRYNQRITYQLIRNKLNRHADLQKLNKHKVMDCTWYLDDGIELKLITDPDNRKLHVDITTKTWRKHIQVFKSRQGTVFNY